MLGRHSSAGYGSAGPPHGLGQSDRAVTVLQVLQVQSVMQGHEVRVTRDPPERHVVLFRPLLLLHTVPHHHINNFPPEPLDYSLEAALFSYFRGAINVFNWKYYSQSVQEDLGEGRYELCCGH